MVKISQKQHLWVTSLLAVTCAVLTTLLILLQSDTFRPLFFGPKVFLPQPTASTTLPFLEEQESIIIPKDQSGSSTDDRILTVQKVLFQYIEIKDSCDVHFEGTCVLGRTGPGLDFPVITPLRNYVVLKVGGQVEHDGHTWYKIVFDEFVRYPDRIPGGMYVAADFANVLFDEGEKTAWKDGSTTTSKRIVVDRATQKLYAYDGDVLFMETVISTGLELSPTAAGTFTIYKKTPSRYMQGPLPGFTDVYDLPGVPWNLYFTQDGAVVHGTYWHNSFGSRYSHGCVNVNPADARKLYDWTPLGAKILIK